MTWQSQSQVNFRQEPSALIQSRAYLLRPSVPLPSLYPELERDGVGLLRVPPDPLDLPTIGEDGICTRSDWRIYVWRGATKVGSRGATGAFPVLLYSLPGWIVGWRSI